jgi:hypothetical protein
MLNKWPGGAQKSVGNFCRGAGEALTVFSPFPDLRHWYPL